MLGRPCFCRALVVLLTATIGVCERSWNEEISSDVTSGGVRSNASVDMKRYAVAADVHVREIKDHLAPRSQALVLASHQSRHALMGSSLLSAGTGAWDSPSNVIILVINMVGDVFATANAGFTATQQLVSMTVPTDIFKTVSDNIGTAFGSGFGVGTAYMAALLDLKGLMAKLDAFKWNDPEYGECPILRRTTAMIDIFLTFLSFAANMASFLGDSLIQIAPPVNVWLATGGRVAGAFCWLMQTFFVPFLQAQTCQAEEDAAAIQKNYNNPSSDQQAIAHEICASKPSAAMEYCLEEQAKNPTCEELGKPADFNTKHSDEMGTTCREWSSKRVLACRDQETARIESLYTELCTSRSKAESQERVIRIIDTAKLGIVEQFSLNGDYSISEATELTHGGVGGSSLAGPRDFEQNPKTMSMKLVNGQAHMVDRQPEGDELAALRNCCLIGATCEKSVENEEDPLELVESVCLPMIQRCLNEVEACGKTIDHKFCTKEYLLTLQPCCPRNGPAARGCTRMA